MKLLGEDPIEVVADCDCGLHLIYNRHDIFLDIHGKVYYILCPKCARPIEVENIE